MNDKDLADLKLVVNILVKLVKDQYSSYYTLSRIVTLYSYTEAERNAIRRLEEGELL